MTHPIAPKPDILIWVSRYNEVVQSFKNAIDAGHTILNPAMGIASRRFEQSLHAANCARYELAMAFLQEAADHLSRLHHKGPIH